MSRSAKQKKEEESSFLPSRSDENNYSSREKLDHVNIVDPSEIGPLNAAVGLGATIVAQNFINEQRMSSQQRRATRSSVYDPAHIATLDPKEADKLTTTSSRLNQILLFLFGLCVMAFSPIVQQLALWNPETGSKEVNFFVRGPMTISYILGILIGSFWSFFQYGSTAMLECFNPKAIVYFITSAIGYTIDDWVEVLIQVQVDAAFWRVIGQSKLLITAFLARFVLGTRQSRTQWILLFASCTTVAAYAMRDIKILNVTNWPAFGLALFSLPLSCCSALATEYGLKKVKNPFAVQITQTRVATLLVSTVFALIELSVMSSWDGILKGWTKRTSLLIAVDLVRSWTTILVIKKFSAVWKSLCVAVALGLTYLISVVLGINAAPFEVRQFILIGTISSIVMAYASAKQDYNTILQHELQMEETKKMEGP